MLERIPAQEEIKELTGDNKYHIWMALCEMIDSYYDMEKTWNSGGKAWKYEYKYRRGGKTLCTLYAKENCIGFMITLGKAEREKFEADRANYSKIVQRIYDDAAVYHDGKWIMFEPESAEALQDFQKLLNVKRRPNKK